MQGEGGAPAGAMFDLIWNACGLPSSANFDVARNPLSTKRAMEIASSGGKPQTFTVLALTDHR
jgi:hypothetical protein